MAAQKGAALLLKINTTGSTYVTVGGLRSTSITLNDEAVDVTNKDSSGNRTLLADGGIHSISVSGSGVFTDAASETTLKDAMNASTFKNFQVIIPDFGTYQGAFMVATLEYAGEHNGEVTYSVTLESSGAITFTSA
jgi:TP901-1 family phage major tail protein|tara:strand:- start:32 stop:439 length:408 start_codon:yes stop_codon:yes gene_type:complete